MSTSRAAAKKLPIESQGNDPAGMSVDLETELRCLRTGIGGQRRHNTPTNYRRI